MLRKIENTCAKFLTQTGTNVHGCSAPFVLASSLARVIFGNRRRQLPEGFVAEAGSFRRIRD